MTQARRVHLHLDLWTDAPIDKLIDANRWRDLMLGKNPTWTDEGRHPEIRVQDVAKVDLITSTPPAKAAKQTPPVPRTEVEELRDDKAVGKKTGKKAKVGK
jgi:hypothetical protein